MLYWYTGQPGHGKTLHAIQRALELKAEADEKHAKDPSKYPLRPLYVCNVRDFDYAKTGAFELTAEQWKTWADSPEYTRRRDEILAAGLSESALKQQLEQLEREKCATEVINPDFLHAIVLVDEAYEHGMFPKRPAGSKVPRWVERVAKHRHYAMDIIGVCQSPDTQADSFLHDLIERHTHVRRRFGTKFVHLREFDRFERNPEKGHPLTIKRVTLPKKIFGLYKSTELDTTERRIPWYFFALPILVIAGLVGVYSTFGRMDKFMGSDAPKPAATTSGGAATRDGASATARGERSARQKDGAAYAREFLPRVPSQPWSAPAYDEALQLSGEPPRLFCMSSLDGQGVNGEHMKASCTCLTEQGTAYVVPQSACRIIARFGQYEPFRVGKGTETPSIAPADDPSVQSAPRASIPGKMSNIGEVSNEVDAPAGSFGRGAL